MAHALDARLPVTILTGFLGSGKTTVLNRLLKAPSLADTAVIVNEFGEVGLDHLLIEQAFENAVLLKNGCICCTVRGDIADTLELLHARAAAGEIPRFRRIVIETTGLADPGPVAHTLVAEASAPWACKLDAIVTTVDAEHAIGQLNQQEEARNQIALADCILLTKTDLVGAEAVAAAEGRVRALNPLAPIRTVVNGDVRPEHIFGLGPDETASDRRIARWLSAQAHHDHDGHDHGAHLHGVNSALIVAQEPIAAADLRRWLDSILSIRGAEILRLKGLVRIEGQSRPLLLQGVHHVLHPPTWLSARPGLPSRSEIVLITRGLSAHGLQESFMTAARRA